MRKILEEKSPRLCRLKRNICFQVYVDTTRAVFTTSCVAGEKVFWLECFHIDYIISFQMIILRSKMERCFQRSRNGYHQFILMTASISASCSILRLAWICLRKENKESLQLKFWLKLAQSHNRVSISIAFNSCWLLTTVQEAGIEHTFYEILFKVS